MRVTRGADEGSYPFVGGRFGEHFEFFWYVVGNQTQDDMVLIANVGKC